MARPTEYGKRIGTGIRLPVELHQRLHAEADARCLGVNLIVIRAIEAFLDRLPPVEP